MSNVCTLRTHPYLWWNHWKHDAAAFVENSPDQYPLDGSPATGNVFSTFEKQAITDISQANDLHADDVSLYTAAIQSIWLYVRADSNYYNNLMFDYVE